MHHHIEASLVVLGLCGAVAAWPAGANAEAGGQKIRVLVVTGGHDFEHDPFFEVFKSFPDVEYVEARHPENANVFDSLKPAADYAEPARFDVIVLYDMWPKISEQGKANLVTLLKRGKGLVALHHCIASYQDWPEYERIIGGRYYIQASPGRPASTFRHDVDMHITVADRTSPITAGIAAFDIHDEAYGKFTVAKDSLPLLMTKHLDSGPCIGWTRGYGNARVCYLELGHDSKAYRNESYRRLVGQAIRWAATRIPVPKADTDGFVPLFNGKDLSGWVVMGDPAGFAVREGVIHSDGEKGGAWLRSARRYSDFILKLDWKVSPNGNSGVFIRCPEEGYPWTTGSEVQITNEPRDEMHCTGSLYGSVAVSPRPDESADTWHSFEIRCAGRRITVISDGVKVVDADRNKVDALKGKPRSGYIGLQDSHASKGSYIEYRNIHIKDLAKPAPAAKPGAGAR
jgi:type 1 glutamine amidotransferase